MGMIIAGVVLLLIGLVWLVGGFVWVVAGHLLHNHTRANEKKAKSPDQNS
jgi:hypothetical protein